MAQAELDALPSLEVKHAHARLELRERQLQELAGTMNELSTEEVSYGFLNLSCVIDKSEKLVIHNGMRNPSHILLVNFKCILKICYNK